MAENYKIRELVNNHPQDNRVVLDDLLKNIISLQVPLGKLEVHNYKDSVVDAIKLITAHETLVIALKRRLRNEVRPEVIKWHNDKPKASRNIHPNSLKNLNNSK